MVLAPRHFCPVPCFITFWREWPVSAIVISCALQIFSARHPDVRSGVGHTRKTGKHWGTRLLGCLLGRTKIQVLGRKTGTTDPPLLPPAVSGTQHRRNFFSFFPCKCLTWKKIDLTKWSFWVDPPTLEPRGRGTLPTT